MTSMKHFAWIALGVICFGGCSKSSSPNTKKTGNTADNPSGANSTDPLPGPPNYAAGNDSTDPSPNQPTGGPSLESAGRPSSPPGDRLANQPAASAGLKKAQDTASSVGRVFAGALGGKGEEAQKKPSALRSIAEALGKGLKGAASGKTDNDKSQDPSK